MIDNLVGFPLLNNMFDAQIILNFFFLFIVCSSQIVKIFAEIRFLFAAAEGSMDHDFCLEVEGVELFGEIDVLVSLTQGTDDLGHHLGFVEKLRDHDHGEENNVLHSSYKG